MKHQLILLASFLTVLFAVGCSEHEPIVVNSVEDVEAPPEGTITLRSALASAESGQPIVFDPSLDGATIELSIVGEEHTTLKGEVMGIREEPRRHGVRGALTPEGYVIATAVSMPPIWCTGTPITSIIER